MEALKIMWSLILKMAVKVKSAKQDSLLSEIKNIVGAEWATNDEAITITYSHDLVRFGPENP